MDGLTVESFTRLLATFLVYSGFQFWPSFIPWIHNFYKNILSCGLNNGFPTGPFDPQRRVRHGDPPSLY